MVLAKRGTGAGRRWATTAVVLVEVAAVLLAGGIALVAGAANEPEPVTAPTTAASPTPAATTPTDGDVPVIRPGRPGESAGVLRPDQVTPDAGPTRNAADVRFVRMMIPHHEQALAMAALAPDRAGSAAVIAVADRIRAAQQPELGVLRSWLRDRGLDLGPDPHGGHAPQARHGMQTPEAMAALAAATGTDFDRRFVRMMTEHHEGAIGMAQEVLTSGVDPQIRELARNIAFEQSVEISRMREAVGLTTR